MFRVISITGFVVAFASIAWAYRTNAEERSAVLAWWKEQAPQGLGNAIAVVLPGAILAGLATALLGMRLSRSTSLALPHGGLGILDVYANGAKLSAWNVDALSAE